MSEAVLVIGSGPAGLTAAAELRRRGIAVDIIERNDVIGSAWRQRYDRLRMNTCRPCSTLTGDKYPPGTPIYPDRDQFVSYLDAYAERHALSVRFGIQVDRIDRAEDGWRLTTSAGDLTAGHVIVATGGQHTPRLPDWPGLPDFPGRFLHSSGYRNAAPYGGADVLVAGAGSSAFDIAYDLVCGGAARVRVSVRNVPHIHLRSSGPFPTDQIARVLFPLPAWLGDRVMRLVGRWTVGDLSPWGLPAPREGVLTRAQRASRTPTIVDRELVDAIKAGQIEIVGDIASIAGETVSLADGSTLTPDTIIAATGFTTGLPPLVGHLGVLNAEGRALVVGGTAAAPGLHFIGPIANIANFEGDAIAAAEQISRNLTAGRSPARVPSARPRVLSGR